MSVDHDKLDPFLNTGGYFWKGKLGMEEGGGGKIFKSINILYYFLKRPYFRK